MRDLAPQRGLQERPHPDWGFITSKLLATMNIRHGPPQLRTIYGDGPPYVPAVSGGHTMVAGSKWGMPTYRFDNLAGTSYNSRGVRMSFPNSGLFWNQHKGDSTVACVIRVSSPSYVNPKFALHANLYYGDSSIRFEWANAYAIRCMALQSGAPVGVLQMPVLGGTIWDRWFGLVCTMHGTYPDGVRIFYAGTCDGEWFGSLSDNIATPAFTPKWVDLSVRGAKEYSGWKGEVGGFLFTMGAWDEIEARRWIMNPFDWARLWGQSIPAETTCPEGDAEVELAIDADSAIDIWSEADPGVELAVDADTSLSSATDADGEIESAIYADADICPEDTP